jgi:CHAD domain-containing protein
MPKSNIDKYLDYFDQRNEGFLKALEQARKYYSVDAVRRLRLEIKCLRALFELTGNLAPSFSSKPKAELFKGLFISAGILRDIDICQSITMPNLETLDLREFFNSLKEAELRKREVFSDLASSFPVEALAEHRKRIAAITIFTTGIRLNRHIDQEIIQYIRKVLVMPVEEKNNKKKLHKQRKQLKTILYLLNMRSFCCGKLETTTKAMIRLKQSCRQLGRWHDVTIACEALKIFLKEEATTDFADPSAYLSFKRNLRLLEHRLLTTYFKKRKQLRESLLLVALNIEKDL